MSCEACAEAEEIDGAVPDCRTEKGCLIPPLDEQGQRILEIRDRLITLHDIVDAGTILRLYDATKEDVEMMAIVEKELKMLREDNSEGKDGNAGKRVDE
ncbi:hypothetical protein A45J_0407 [hot springs metagenome]|uniref:Uncharacterized protein n=1 Tax=hot springs metagenome TaxID=433727 RepID=A0A5J4L313_9ZZZZ